MRYMDGKIKTYLKDLAAKRPSPGGGSSAALGAAMAASLVSMACHFTCGKPAYKKIHKRAVRMLDVSLRQRAQLEKLMDEDIRAYQAKDLAATIEVPAQVARLSFEIAREALFLMQHGNRNLKTDAALAVTLAVTSFIAALSYVGVNIRWWPAAPVSFVTRYKDLEKLIPDMTRMRQDAEASLGYSSGR